MKLALSIALKHLLSRRRQSLISLLGTVLGVSFFLAISSLMQGSEADFIRRLIDSMPHISISDEYRSPRTQPVEKVFDDGAIELRHVKPLTETRGLRGFADIMDYLATISGLRASASLTAQTLISFAGRDVGITLNGITPVDFAGVSKIDDYMRQGELQDLDINPDGIIIGSALARNMRLEVGRSINVVATDGRVRNFKIIGIFHSGQAGYDTSQAFVQIKRVQALTGRPNRVNSIIIQLDDPWQARAIAESIEARVSYKTLSWQESSEDLMTTLTVRNIIMYTIVSAVLIVAAFGIYNVLSTVVMEKHRDIAILKAMGYRSRDIEHIFVIEGAVLGFAGACLGLPLGTLYMSLLGSFSLRFPGSDPVQIPLDWSWPQFAIAAGFALAASLMAGWLPARKGARVDPVDILRGAV
jgi:lipoprotein-releasing system permease protein